MLFRRGDKRSYGDARAASPLEDFSLLGIAGQAGSSSDSDLVKAIRAATAQTANQAGQKIVEKSLNIQPSLTVRPGWPLRVIIHKDLILSPFQF